MLLNFYAKSLNLYMEQGGSYFKEFNLLDDGTSVDLTGYALSMQIKEYSGVKPLVIVSDVYILANIPSTVVISIESAETDLLVKSRYVYRLMAISPTEATILMFGQILISNF
jgi:hypothetical protein